ncbi:RelA/SpoT domain-containing protein [Mycobacterium terramassiliense]|uniref:PpGpp synthetase catalytic domain (RelA/SpoT-type nucleotidyltranferase) n=1 Tax=Mycobacterium terramassiliense TaxID=1841859 RepID=A0A2U3N5M2_9MYCO|nr:RelA/SpoT domain-containing protein [Mycobacterium terramassiliense]SPM26740.1 ppGpp synthetase catalytic domain (RelA/SpoT-type nucleotidyltranferase) [Mycobacterium terramassiliense]
MNAITFSPEVIAQAQRFADNAVAEMRDRLTALFPVAVDHSHGVSTRIKTRESLVRKQSNTRPDRSQDALNDVIGMRLIVTHQGLLKEVSCLLPGWAADWELVQVKRDDRFEQPDESGYRALHFDYRPLPDNAWKLPTEMGVELQITTWLMRLHANASRELAYPTYQANTRTLKTLREMAARLHQLDEEIERDFTMITAN